MIYKTDSISFVSDFLSCLHVFSQIADVQTWINKSDYLIGQSLFFVSMTDDELNSVFNYSIL